MMRLQQRGYNVRLLVLCGIALSQATCDDTMRDQPRFEPYEASAFFSDGTSMRERIPGTVSRFAVIDDRPARPPVDLDLIRHGQSRFNIFCAPCHGRDGYGNGIVVQRGYPKPPSVHNQRLRSVVDRHLYIVTEKGLGKMPPYGSVTSSRDRWAIVSYIRALQRSQNATLSDVPDKARTELLSRDNADQ